MRIQKIISYKMNHGDDNSALAWVETFSEDNVIVSDCEETDDEADETDDAPILDECIPDGEDFQNWISKTHLKIHPELINKNPRH